MISFLFGSGFSFAEGVPGVNEINNRLINLRADDIYWGSDQSAFFLKDGQQDPNGWFPQNVIDRTFVQELLQFYIKKVIKDEKDFNYERFFDYYYLAYRNSSYPSELQTFLEEFREKHTPEKDYILYDNTNLLLRFNTIFSQLVADILTTPEHYNDVSFLNYPQYESFIHFLHVALSSHEIKVHSLNHDLFFEHIASKHSKLFKHYCDGYTSLGSPYYGDVTTNNNGLYKTRKERLQFFNNVYDNKLCFYKLHGSIDTYIFNLASPNPDLTRVKRNWQVKDLYKEERNNQTSQLEYVSGFQEQYPDFLSGTTAKTLSYENEYYKTLFDHFVENLKESDKLIVIGYGFRDAKINDMIEENYLSRGKKMIVVDPYPNKTAYSAQYNVEYIEKGVTDVLDQEWLSCL